MHNEMQITAYEMLLFFYLDKPHKVQFILVARLFWMVEICLTGHSCPQDLAPEIH